MDADETEPVLLLISARGRNKTHLLSPFLEVGVQPCTASSGDDRSSADVFAVEQRRTPSNSNQRLPPPPTPTAPKRVSWAITMADTGEEDSKQKEVPDAKMRTRTQPSRRGKGAAALVPAPVRKSTRRKSRPLQRWLGEKFLYTSWLGTIGIKSYSPGEDGMVALRVESFLPPQYADLVARAGRC